MVDRVQGKAAVVRTLTQPALAPSLAKLDVGVVGVGDGAYRCHAGTGNETLLARIQAKDRHSTIAAHELSVGAGGTGDLTALARLELDVMNDRAHGDARKRHGIARLHVGTLAGRNHAIAGSKTLRSQDIAHLTIFVTDESDERRAIRII